jgi:hypothetical protein
MERLQFREFVLVVGLIRVGRSSPRSSIENVRGKRPEVKDVREDSLGPA